MSEARYLSRAAAFEAQGVALKFPASSWSGVRADDGMVVFAIDAEDIVDGPDGSACLLWATVAPASSRTGPERLEHCRRAVLRGLAETLVSHGDRGMDPRELLAIRVETRRGEYWACWGSRALAFASRIQRPAPRLAYALAA